MISFASERVPIETWWKAQFITRENCIYYLFIVFVIRSLLHNRAHNNSPSFISFFPFNLLDYRSDLLGVDLARIYIVFCVCASAVLNIFSSFVGSETERMGFFGRLDMRKLHSTYVTRHTHGSWWMGMKKTGTNPVSPSKWNDDGRKKLLRFFHSP